MPVFSNGSGHEFLTRRIAAAGRQREVFHHEVSSALSGCRNNAL
jgi:hypothetical protein